MKILNFKYLISISFIILLAILCFTLFSTKKTEEVPERAILVFELGGLISG